VVRVGVSTQYTQTVYIPVNGERDKPYNIRVSGSTIYLF